MSTYIINNLYQSIIKQNAPVCNKLRIISGYASPEFTEKVLTEYPNLSIDLYIGMTPHGISANHHYSFINLMKKYFGRLFVYYQVSHPATHTKLYSWYYQDCQIKNFGGSANFTHNGFEIYNEILIEIGNIESNIFMEQMKKSILATDKYVSESIFISPTPLVTDSIMIETPNINDGKDKSLLPVNNISQSSSPRSFIKKRYSLTRNQKIIGYQNFQIPILSSENIESKAVNAWKRNQIPYLTESTNYQFSKFFPVETEMTFYTDDNKVFKGIIKADRSNRLIFKPDIYQYLRERLGITEKRPILQRDLEAANKFQVNIEKISELEYHFSL